MPSPFPGMNPYLEHSEVWHDFHESILPRVRDALVAQVGRDYVVKIEEHIYVQEVPEESARLIGRGDVSLSQGHPVPSRMEGGTAVLDAPTEVIPVIADEFRESFLEIRDRSKRELITVIELLSPAN